MLIKDISIFSFCDHFVQQSATVCVILVESIMKNIYMKLVCIWVSSSRVSFKNISIFSPRGILCFSELNHLCNLVEANNMRNLSVRLF